MIDDKPYIIVDNQKLSPIESSPRQGPIVPDRAGPREQPFGVVDRVTISREARERARLHQAQWEADMAALENQAKRQSTTAPLLTYSPKQLR